MINMLKQSVPGLHLSIEEGTQSVPQDGQYHVVLYGVIVLSSTSKSRALSEYRRIRDELLADRPSPEDLGHDGREVLRREMASREADSFLAQSYSARRAKGMRKGGKAGRQGYK